MLNCYPLMCLSIIFHFCSGNTVANDGITKKLSTKDVVNYLVRYGYLPDKRRHVLFNSAQNVNVTTNSTYHSTLEIQSLSLYNDREIQRALSDFQTHMSLPKSGVFDSKTEDLMKQSRCGVKDKSSHAPWVSAGLRNNVKRKRRYVLQGSSWPKNILTYSIVKSSIKISAVQQNQTIWQALRRWSEVSPLIFKWSSTPHTADIKIRFATGDHGDGQPFDGSGSVLAHAFYPSYGGEIHFDDDEQWNADDKSTSSSIHFSTSGKSLLRVAIHEIGHSLGIDHSPDTTAMMNAIYRQGNPVLDELQNDDIAAVQSIYGMCETSFDSIFSWMGNGRTYVFKNDVYWHYDDASRKTSYGYPRETKNYWAGIPDNIDEAFLWAHDWKTYFFKGSLYYKFNDVLDRVDDGYPKAIQSGWPGLPNDLDAAFTWSNSISYFFKGNLCYRYDNNNGTVHHGYPKNISSTWPGIPNNIDTAFRNYYDGNTYFFKGFYYWKWDDVLHNAMGPLQIKYGWRNHCFV